MKKKQLNFVTAFSTALIFTLLFSSIPSNVNLNIFAFSYFDFISET